MAEQVLSTVCFFGGYARGYPRNDVLKKGLAKIGVRVVECRTSPKRRVFTRYPLLLWRYLRRCRSCDILYVPEFRHKDVPLAYAIGRLTGKPVVFDPLVSRYDTKVGDRGDAREGSYQAFHNRNLDRLSLGLSTLVLSDTATHADYYAREFRIDRDKIRVLPVGFDEEIFSPNGVSPARDRPADTFNAVFVGNYLPLHGADVIAAAAARLRGDSRIRFIMIGRGQTYPEVETFVESRHLENVILKPRVSMEEMARAVADADVSLGIFGRTPKATRVVANKVYQSMAVGRPVITADTPAAREFFSDGEDVLLVPAGSPEALARAIVQLADDPPLGERVGETAARRARERFASTRIASLFVSHVETLLAGRLRTS